MYDALVVGGGFYGAVIASYLVRRRGFARVALVEREPQLLARASYHNQARVHNGYHYPRSFTTAYRSRINLPRFLHDFPAAVKRDFTKVYAIARRNSKTTARQFERFCQGIGASLEPAPPAIAALFEPKLIEAAYLVQEYAFDALALREWAVAELARCGVDQYLCVRVTGVVRESDGLRVECEDGGGAAQVLAAHCLFNCTYSGLNQFAGDYPGTSIRLKHEITEMALIGPPAALRGLGITVMDGPFFSLMPFPPRGLHTVSHVRYTPHLAWLDRPGEDPYARLAAYPRESRADRMLRDIARYLPAIADAVVVDSLFEVKTVLTKNEGDDGRPILFERHEALPGCYSILGGKIDNIYDVLERLDAERLPVPERLAAPVSPS
jgi:glycine/D-amino acid oxidase-like deaminating enzyme